MNFIVQKFGGTSVEDATGIKRVTEIVKNRTNTKRLVVVSALAGVTNKLISIAENAYRDKVEDALKALNELENRHKKVVADCGITNDVDILIEELSDIFKKIKNMISGIALIGELTSRSLDKLMSYGEILSSKILFSTLKQNGIKCALIDAQSLVITDSDFGNANPIMELIKTRVDSLLIPAFREYDVIVTQGFIGSNIDGITTTLGRGGSDYTASLLGSVINAEVIEIWTDVDGIMTADPRIVSDARLVSLISFNEASELAYFGAKVLHPNTILPAIQKNIPVKILNSKNPNSIGTKILSVSDTNNTSNVKSIAYKKGIAVVSVYSSRMLLAYGFLAKLFSIFEKYKKSVDVISTSEVSVSLTIDNLKDINKIEKDLNEIGEIQIAYNKSIVCVVGEGIIKDIEIVAKIFSTLATENIKIDMISQGASKINITIVIDENVAERAVKVLHKELFLD